MTSWRRRTNTEPTSETVKPDAARTGSLIRRVESIAKPAETATAAWPFFWFPGPSETSRRKEAEQIVIFTNQVASGRNAAIRAGWNDAAWGQPHREPEAARALWYERGYAGGLVYRQKDQPEPEAPGTRSN